MARHHISNNGSVTQEMFSLLFLLGLLLGASVLAWTRISLILAPACLLLMVALYRFYDRYRKSSFDERNFYYEAERLEIAIPLSDILAVTTTYWPVAEDWSHIMKISFRRNSELQSIKIIPTATHKKNFDTFIKRVREVNPQAEIDYQVLSN